MKKIFSLFLAFLLIFCVFMPTLAVDDDSKEYASLTVEYSDNLGMLENLNIMVKDKHVYVDALQFAERLGYSVNKTDEYVTIYNIDTLQSDSDTPVMLLIFYFNSKKVDYYIDLNILTYEAPFESINDDNGVWVPLKYAMYALKSSMLIVNNVVEISMPRKDLNDLIFEVAKKGEEIRFDFFKDAYFGDGDFKVKLGCSRIVNLFSGLLKFEGESWALTAQQFFGDTSAYDQKYAEKFVKLFCTNSDKELEELNKQITVLNDIFDEKGNLGLALSKIKFDIDSDVNSLYNQCQMIYEHIGENNVDLSKYNSKYLQFERAFDKQTWFSNTGEAVMDVQKGVSEATKALKVLGGIAEVTGYLGEFANKDVYSVDAITEYLTKFGNSTTLPRSYVQALKSNSDLFKSNIAEYALVNYIKEHAVEWIADSASIGQNLCAQSNLILLAWNIASNTIPFIKNGLSSADNFELSVYANALQVSSYCDYVSCKREVLGNIDKATSKNAYKIAQYLYTYLKSSYISRDAAVGSFDDIKNKEGVSSVLDGISAPNKLIAKYLARIKMMSKDNRDFSVGFFKDSSDWLVNNYNDSDLLKLLGYSNELVFIESERETSDERDIVLVLDVSGSMEGTPLEETKKAATKFINTILKEDASIGIVVYDGSATVLSDFSKNETNLVNIVSGITDQGTTNIDDGLTKANELLEYSNAEKKIIVLMSDGLPNCGREGDDLIAFADSIKDSGTYIYSLGFFENTGGSKSSAQHLMEEIASDGCHYEVADADDLIFFFGDIADQINGQKFIYVRIACPVDVTVSYRGESLSSSDENFNDRTSFGVLSLEDIEDSENKIKTLRLKDGNDYEIKINGTGRGKMDYTIGYMDDNGEYSDMRNFRNIEINRRTVIDTSTKYMNKTTLNVDEDGDGKYDLKFRAGENEYGELVDYTYIVYIVLGIVGAIALLVTFVVIKSKIKNRKKVRRRA